jgi:hypothetical protein
MCDERTSKNSDVPSKDARRRAIAQIRKLFEEADSHADQLGISDDEIDAAVEEASERTRGR